MTGYIGGDAFYEIHNAHPEIEYTCLVRNSDKGAQVASQYPKVRLVYGDLDSVEILEEEAKKADIVMSKPFPAIANTINLSCSNRLGGLRSPCRSERPNQRHFISAARDSSFSD